MKNRSSERLRSFLGESVKGPLDNGSYNVELRKKMINYQYNLSFSRNDGAILDLNLVVCF